MAAAGGICTKLREQVKAKTGSVLLCLIDDGLKGAERVHDEAFLGWN